MARKVPPIELSPCEAPEIDASYYEYAGFKKGFTKHDYCQRTHIGFMLEPLGLIIKCQCGCHVQKKPASRIKRT